MERLNMLSLNKQKNPSEGQNFEKEDASMQEFISCSGTVIKTEETPSLGEISFDFKMDCADISNVNPEKEGIVTQCLEELENKLRKKHQVATLKYSLAKVDSTQLPSYIRLTVNFTPSLDQAYPTCLRTQSEDRSWKCRRRRTCLKRLTFLVKEKKEIWNERYLRAIRNMSTSSTEKPETEANTISKLQDELRELRGFLEPSHRGRGGRRFNRGRGRGGRRFPSV
ncbi:Hypothetical predicted protein [Mytilus galloprovincialis]|uniref:Uncharacterized protein n=1 Tax=Mytilus galloprovincialis TaxID=29158 RepID=A0A8B6BPF1_MYTGA|nr:Hypothetical predicted protein [Mytilus galloprovincialis]